MITRSGSESDVKKAEASGLLNRKVPVLNFRSKLRSSGHETILSVVQERGLPSKANILLLNLRREAEDCAYTATQGLGSKGVATLESCMKLQHTRV